jgi:uncharacterized protein YndB with AHSA1/START domain
VPEIEKTIEIRADQETVWKIISDLENESDYWYGTKEVRMISKDKLTVRREITQNFRNHKILQEAVLQPPNRIVISYLKGLTEGTKTMTIEQTEQDGVSLGVSWDVRFSGLYWFATPIIARHTANGTEHALERIKSAAEALAKKAEN